jgi:hypothetical protein
MACSEMFIACIKSLNLDHGHIPRANLPETTKNKINSSIVMNISTV